MTDRFLYWRWLSFAPLKLVKTEHEIYVVLVCALLGLIALRFYVFYMISVAIAGHLSRMQQVTAKSFVRQFTAHYPGGLALIYRSDPVGYR